MNSKVAPGHLKDLVLICMNDKLSTKESLEFIKIRTNESISKSWFYEIKKSLTQDEILSTWLSHSRRIGWAIEHKRQIDELDEMRLKLKKRFDEEISCSDPPYSLIIKLSSEIRELDNALDDRYNMNPVVSEVLEKIKEKESLNENLQTI